MRAGARLTLWLGVGVVCAGAAIWYYQQVSAPSPDLPPLPPEPALARRDPEPPTAEIVRLKGHTDAVFSVAISADGKRVVSGSNDRTAIVWDVATRRPLQRLEGHAQGVVAVGLSANGRRVLTGSLDGTARVWDASTGELLAVLQGVHRQHVHAAAISPDGTRVLTASCDWTCVLWDVAKEKPLQTYKHPGDCHNAAFSPDGKTFLTGCYVWPDTDERGLRLYDATTGAKVADFKVPSVDFIAYADGGRQAFVKAAFQLYLLDVPARQLTPLKVNGFGRAPIGVFPDGTRVISYGFIPMVMDARTGGGGMDLPRGAQINGEVRALAVAPDQTWAVVGGGGRGNPWGDDGANRYEPAADCDLRIVPVTREAIAQISKAERQARVTTAVSAAAASADRGRVFAAFGDGTVIGWKTVSGEVLGKFDAGVGRITSAAASPDGTRFAGCFGGTGLAVFDSAGKSLGTVALPDQRLQACALDGDARHVFTGGWTVVQRQGPKGLPDERAGPVQVFLVEVASGNPVRTFAGPEGSVEHLALSPDGQSLVAVISNSHGGECAVLAWDVASGRPLWSFPIPQGGVGWSRLCATAFTGDGSTVAVAFDKALTVLDARAGKLIRELPGNTAPVRAMAFDPAAKRLWVATVGEEACSWDRETGLIGRWVRVGPEALAFRFDGAKRLLLTVRDGKLIETELEP